MGTPTLSRDFSPVSLVTEGSDGGIWFTESGANALGRFDPTTRTEATFPVALAAPTAIITGPDGNLWFTSSQGIGSFDPTTHQLTTYAQPGLGGFTGLAFDGLGNLWLTNDGLTITEFDPTTQALSTVTPPTPSEAYAAIVEAPDGSIWSGQNNGASLIRIDPTTHDVTTYDAQVSDIASMIVGPDNKLWYGGSGATNQVGSIDPTSHVVKLYSVPLLPNISFDVAAGLADGPAGEVTAALSFGGIAVIDPTTGSSARYVTQPGNGSPEAMTTGPGGIPYYVKPETQGGWIGEVLDVPASTTTLAVSPNPGTQGQSVTLTATVAPASGPGTATGLVAFYDESGSSYLSPILLGYGTLDASGQATLTTPNLAVGPHTLDVQYFGSTSLGQGLSNAVTEVINPPPVSPTTTILDATPNPAKAGQVVSLTAVVSATSGGTPTGFVTFYDGSTDLGQVSVGPTGQAILVTSSLAVGQHVLTAHYGGGTGFLASTSTPIIQTIEAPPVYATTTTISASPNPAYLGTPVTLTATVTPAAGAPGPANGIVTFFDQFGALGVAPLSSAGTATFTLSNSGVGTFQVYAAFDGFSPFAPSQSPNLSLVVQSVPTTITLSSSPNPSAYGQAVVYSATVTSPAGFPQPQGTVAFLETTPDGYNITLGYTSLSGGQARITSSEAIPGAAVIKASYYGDNSHQALTSAAYIQQVAKGVTTTTLVANPNPQTTGRPVELTAVVTGYQAGGIFGTVTFFDGPTTLGSVEVYQGSPAVLDLASLPAGVHHLTAVYSGSGLYAPSVSNPVAETIVAVPATITTIYPSFNPVPYNKPLAITAVVTPVSPAGAPTGTVTFRADAVGYGELDATVPVGPGGLATWTTSLTLPFQLYNIEASYSGDRTYSPSVANPVVETVGPPDGPLVTSLKRAGSKGTTTGLVVTFDEPLHPQTAGNPGNYVLVGPTGRRIAFRSAVLDATAETVTLTTRQPLAAGSRYVFTILGVGPSGVTDTSGRLLDGTYVGRPGTNYSTALVPARLALSAAVPTAPRFRTQAHHAAAHPAVRWHR